MGTTFTGLVVVGGDAVIAHAGDSRAYLVRDGIAVQLTEDHTLLARLLASGMPLAEGPASARWKGVITNALGFGDDTRVVTFMVPLSDGDRLLLCSDGVSEYVGEAEVGQILVGQPEPGPGRAAAGRAGPRSRRRGQRHRAGDQGGRGRRAGHRRRAGSSTPTPWPGACCSSR
jgi:serine/threonine protein phosphatase PrpC